MGSVAATATYVLVLGLGQLFSQWNMDGDWCEIMKGIFLNSA